MPKELKISDMLKGFLADCDMKKSSLSTYNNVMLLFIKYLFVNRLPFEQVNREHIIQYKNHLLANHEPRTVNLYLSVIRKFYIFMGRDGHYKDMAKGIRLAKVPHTYKRMPLTAAQVHTLLSSIDITTPGGRRDHAMINLMVKTGLRRIEVCRLDVGDLIELNGKHCLKIQRKGSDAKDQRKVLSLPVFDELQTMICERNNIKDNDPLFIAYSIKSKGTRLSVNSISTIIKTYMDNIGLTGELYSCHSLRHTAAVTLLDNGYDMHYVQMFLGHSSPATTQLYTRLISDRIAFDEAGTNTLDKVFDSG